MFINSPEKGKDVKATTMTDNSMVPETKVLAIASHVRFSSFVSVTATSKLGCACELWEA